MKMNNSVKIAIFFAGVMLVQFLIAGLSLLLMQKLGLNQLEPVVINSFLSLFNLIYWLNAFVISFLFYRSYLYQQGEDARDSDQEIATENDNEQQEQLEQMVQERTLELHIALQELEEVNRELAEKTTLDELTGLFNRRCYDQKILAEHRRSRRNLTPLSLIVIDIDHFKNVNDTYGHIAGDTCIVWIADKIKQCLGRSSDIGCRYGGEEFCIILPETDAKGAIALAEQLRALIFAEKVHFEEKIIPLTISCGVSTYEQQKNILPEQIFAAADKALYVAKDSGRNQVQHLQLIEIPQHEENLI